MDNSVQLQNPFKFKSDFEFAKPWDTVWVERWSAINEFIVI